MISEYDLVKLLYILIDYPDLVKEVNDEYLNTELCLIEKDCMGACIKLTFDNKAVTSVDLIERRGDVFELFDKVIENCTEMSCKNLLKRISECF